MMALFFLKASYRFLKQAEAFERENTYPNEDYNASIIGGLISSASFLECYINEVFTSIAEEDYTYCSRIPVDKLKLVEKMWKRKIPRTARYSVLEKYDIFLDLIGAPGFNPKANPYLDASILIEIRNELVHYEPIWVHFGNERNNAPIKPHKFQAKLKGKFGPSKLHPSKHFMFPHYCLSAECLAWAFNSSKNMAVELDKNANLGSVFQGLNWENVK